MLSRPTVVGVACTAGALMTVQAAGIVYSGIQNRSVYMGNTTHDTEVINVDGLGASEFTLDGYWVPASKGGGGNFPNGILTAFSASFDPVATTSSGTILVKMAVDTPVGASSVFTSAANATAISGGQWAAGDSGYFGFRFNPGGGIRYGWGQLARSGDGLTLNLIDWAYADWGGSILAGQTVAVPEPETSAWVLATGVLAGIVWRRGRRR
jgi:hypothetical protein